MGRFLKATSPEGDCLRQARRDRISQLGSLWTAPDGERQFGEYTPAVSELRSGITTFSHSGLKHMGAQTDAGATPAVQATNTYDAFGATQSSSGTWQGPFGTAGAFNYQSPQTGNEQGGLHLPGHRYYDASTGRFLTRDPIGDGSNWYAYCENDPLALADPSGLAGVLIDGDSDFFAGWGDELTEIPLPGGSFSGSDWVRGQLGVNEVVDKDGAAYKWGRGIGFVHGLVKGFAKKGLKLGFDGARSIVIEKHHEIPRAVSKRLRHLDMDEFKGTVPIPKDVHRDWHSGPGKGGYYNTLWRDMLGGDWKRSDWDRVTDDDVRKALDEFRRNFGF